MTEELKQEIESEFSVTRIRRKRDQAYEMAGLARQDRDEEDSTRRLEEAKAWEVRLKELTQ